MQPSQFKYHLPNSFLISGLVVDNNDLSSNNHNGVGNVRAWIYDMNDSVIASSTNTIYGESNLKGFTFNFNNEFVPQDFKISFIGDDGLQGLAHFTIRNLNFIGNLSPPSITPIIITEPWQLRKDHFKVIIDPGHGFWESSDPFSYNATNRMNYPDRPVMIIENGQVIGQSGGKAFRDIIGIQRTDFDYTEGEGTVFFSRALKEKFDEINVSHDFTRDLTVPFDVLLGNTNLGVRKPNINNDWRHASVPYLINTRKIFPKKSFKENRPGNIHIRWNFTNLEQQKDSTKDFVFISLHSNAGSRRGTVTGWVSQGPANLISRKTKCEIKGSVLPLDELSESKKAFAEFVHNNVIEEIKKRVNPSWNDIGVVDARVSEEFCETPAVLNFTQVPSALTEIAFHTNIEDLKFLDYNNLTTKRIVADGIFNGIIKYFNSSVDSYDSAGNKKDSFTIGENIYAKGRGFPANKDVKIFVTAHRNITNNEWNRNVSFSSIRINSITATTDSNGDLPLRNVWASNVAGNYDIVVAIYNKVNFNYVDALDDLTGIPGFSVS